MGRTGKKIRMAGFRKWLATNTESNNKNWPFSRFTRTDNRRKERSESLFSFYDRSAWPEIRRIRSFITVMISKYPETETNEILSRIRSGSDQDFLSAYFELVLHEALTNTGHKLIPHPDMPKGVTTKPDFLVEAKDGNQFYLEARLAKQIAPPAPAMERAIFDYLDKFPHESFHILTSTFGHPEDQPSAKSLTSKIHSWLNELDPDQIIKELESGELESLPNFTWEHKGWTFSATAFPSSPERRGKLSQLICGEEGRGGAVDSVRAIKNAIADKGGKYGAPDKPYVIAVNIDNFALDNLDVYQALYGQEQIIFSPGKPVQISSVPNGALLTGNGPRHRRVSAIWVFSDLNPGSTKAREPTLHLNPWAYNPVPETLLTFNHSFLHGSTVKLKGGVGFSKFLRLPKDWPYTYSHKSKASKSRR